MSDEPNSTPEPCEEGPLSRAHDDTVLEPFVVRRAEEGSIPKPPVSMAPGVSVAPFDDEATLEPHGEVGRGGMATVVRVSEPALQRDLAMKVLHSAAAAEEDAALRFVEEAQITGQLDHPNIVPVHALARDAEGQLFFTMKLVRGRTFGEILDGLGEDAMDGEHLEELVKILIKVCEALAFAHSRGVVHRDLKPANIMVGSHGQVYVMDWGIAMLRGKRLADDDGKIMGTPAFMAPEQAMARDQTPQVDVFGLGGLLYAMLTGHAPNQGDNLNALLFDAITKPARDPHEVAPHRALPPELCRIAMKALALRPSNRHATIDAVREDLEAFLRGGGWFETLHVAAGDTIVEAGDPMSAAFVVMKGVCEAHADVDGEQHCVHTVSVGGVIGVAAVLTGGTCAATWTALEDVSLKVVTRASLDRELERSPWLKALFHGVTDRFRELDTILAKVLDG